MSGSQAPVFIVDGLTAQPVEGTLFDKITEKHIQDTESLWAPWMATAIASQSPPRHEESRHWDWRKKMGNYGGQLGFPCFAIECCGETQGLMIVNTLESCRIEEQKGKPLVYVEYLATAPWNRQSLAPTPKYTAVDSVLIAVAIQLSLEQDFEGRVGLHSLPQSSGFYGDKCGMTSFGVDPHKSPLLYFEMTANQANAFLAKGN